MGPGRVHRQRVHGRGSCRACPCRSGGWTTAAATRGVGGSRATGGERCRAGAATVRRAHHLAVVGEAWDDGEDRRRRRRGGRTRRPIEYKRGKAPDLPEGAYLPERAQLCAQVLLLRDHGYRCDEAHIYFAGSRRRVPIAIDDSLVRTTLAAAERARTLTSLAEAPAPLVDSPKCNGCSLVGVCLPDEVNLLKGLASTAVPVDDEAEASPPLRRLHPASDDKLPLYVQEQGARIGLDGDCVVVHSRKGPSTTARLPNTSQVVLYGNVQVSAQAMRALLERCIPVTFLSYGGWYFGRATGVDSKNVELKLAQHRAAADPEFCYGWPAG